MENSSSITSEETSKESKMKEIKPLFSLPVDPENYDELHLRWIRYTWTLIALKVNLMKG